MSDDTDNAETSGVSRRDAIKVSAIAAATLAVPAMLNNAGVQSMTGSSRNRFDADIVIIGTGFGGLGLAIKLKEESNAHSKSQSW